MSRLTKILFGSLLIVIVLACNVLTSPIKNVEGIAATAESIATLMPVSTIQALPSSMPDLGIPTGLPDIGNMANPQGAPVSEWNGIPVLPSATAGEETTGLYSYKADSTVDDAINYYKDEMVKLGWSEFFVMPDTGSGALLSYQKDDNVSTITITSTEDGVVLVFLTFQ